MDHSILIKKTYELAVTTTYDEKKLKEALDDMSCFQEENVVAPKDACLKEQNGEYVIVPEEEGNTLDRTKVEKAVKDAIESGKTEINLEMNLAAMKNHRYGRMILI